MRRGVRSHAECEDHEVCRIPLAGTASDGELAAIGLLEAGDAVVEHDMHAVEFEELFDDASVLSVERGEDLVGQLDNGHLEPPMSQILGHLEADEAGTDDDGMPRGPHRLEPRVLSMPARKLVPRSIHSRMLPSVWHGPHREDAWKIDSGDWGRIEGAPGDSTSLS